MRNKVETDKFQFSQSKVTLYRRCRFAYHTKYVEGFTRLIKARPLQFGIMVHEMLEAHANRTDPFKVLNDFSVDNAKLFAAEKEMYGEIVEDIRLIMTEYFDYYSEDKTRFLKYKGQRAEHWLEVPVDGDMLFVMKLDALIRTPNKLRWVLDHKTFKRKPSDDDRWRNVQSAVYLKACELMGMKPFDGFAWNYVHSKPPTVPQLLKNGTVGIKAINTLPAVVHQFIEDNGLEAGENVDLLLNRANANVKNYFFRVFTPMNTQIVDYVYEAFIDTAREMKDHHGEKKDHNIGMHCSWCDYAPICRAALTGGDADFVKEREYESREERHKREEKELKEKERKEKGGKKKAKGRGKSRRKG